METESNIRPQHTISASASVTGFGLFTGADVRLEFCPAPVDHGIVFERTDRADPVPRATQTTETHDFIAPSAIPRDLPASSGFLQISP